MLKNGFFLLCWLALSLNQVGAQTVYVPSSHWVYDYLDRLETRGVLPDVLAGTKPMTRLEIASLLTELITYQQSGGRLSTTDAERLRFLSHEFMEEIEQLGFSSAPYTSDPARLVTAKPFRAWLPDFVYGNGRNLFAFASDPVKVYWDPIFYRSGLYANADTLSSREQVFEDGNGFVMWGTLGNRVGFLTDIRDTREWGTRTYPGKKNTTREGLGFVRGAGDHIYHDETIASVVYHHKYLTLQFGKDVNRWGPGYSGQLALSDRATSYDLFKVQVAGKKIKFTALYGLLQHYNGNFFRDGHQEKSLAAHRLEFSPLRFLDIGLHEIVLFAGRRIEPSYLNPVMFYRSAEHYLGDRDNVTMGLDFEVKGLYRTKLYGELFIDDITTSRLGTGFYGNKYAYLLGLYHVDVLGVDNLDFRLEYARVRPYTYTHKNDLTAYRHYSTGLGHWIGPNADDIFVQLSYQYSRRLGIKLHYEKTRHGANPPGMNYGGDLFRSHLTSRDPEYVDFLQGILDKTRSFAALLSYEFFRNGFLKIQYRHFYGTRTWQQTLDFPGRRNEVVVMLSLNY